MAAKPHFLVRTILALVILAAALAWSPAAAAPDFAGKGPGRLTARLVGADLIVDAGGFPSDHAYFVKARRQIRYAWARLGALETEAGGRLHGRFVLPKELRTAPFVRVCLKDIYTDQAYCTNAWR